MPESAGHSDNGESPHSLAGAEVVITGVGIVSPIGIGREEFWNSLVEQRSGIHALKAFDPRPVPCKIAGEVDDFEPKKYVRPRKSLKVMSRDIQLGFTAADLAIADSGLQADQVDPERKGVVFGADMLYCDLEGIIDAYRTCIVDGKFDYDRWGSQALGSMYPLWMLKFLPNMPACHIGIAQDCRGPNNSITLGEVSSLQAITEATRVIQRGQADVMIAGGTSSPIHPTCFEFRGRGIFSLRNGDPTKACRPFDRDRDGMVHGEGAGAFLLERRDHAEARGADVYGKILSYASTFAPMQKGTPCIGTAIRRGIEQALRHAGLQPEDIGHVNARGLSTVEADRIEAQAIHDVLGDVPVTAPKSFFGSTGAASGAMESVASVLGMKEGQIPVTLNYEHADAECPVNVVHDEPALIHNRTALLLSQSRNGQAVAIIVRG